MEEMRKFIGSSLRFGLAIFICGIDLPIVSAQERSDMVLDSRDATVQVIHTVTPEYPFEARRQRMVGDGVFILDVNSQTGIVRSVRISKTTGHKLLDDAAMAALRKWRFKPGKYRRIREKMAFTITGVR